MELTTSAAEVIGCAHCALILSANKSYRSLSFLARGGATSVCGFLHPHIFGGHTALMHTMCCVCVRACKIELTARFGLTRRSAMSHTMQSRDDFWHKLWLTRHTVLSQYKHADATHHDMPAMFLPSASLSARGINLMQLASTKTVPLYTRHRRNRCY